MSLYRKIVLSAVMMLMFFATSAIAQDKQVSEAVKMIRTGNVAGAKVVLSSFDQSKEYPATLYLSGLLCDTPNVALKKFQKVVSDYVSSVWADDAQWQIFQCYILSGQTDKAAKACTDLEKKFSNSNYVNSAKDILYNARKFKSQNDLAGSGRKAVTIVKTDAAASKTSVKTEDAAKTAVATSTSKAGTTAKVTETQTVKKQTANGKHWAIQVGSFHSIEVAREESERITKRYRMRNSIIEKEVNGTKLFAVVVGNYATKEDAEASRKTVEKACNCDTMVIRK